MRRMAYLSLLGLLIGCTAPANRSVQPAFYHWTTELAPKATELAYLQEIGAEKLYVKFFDVDWDFNRKEAIPLASIEIKDASQFQAVQIIPTLFITNRSLIHLPETKLEELATKIATKVEALWIPLAPFQTIQEIQLDCDWSAQTRAAYFQLLELLREALDGPALSATIRLHQVKYFDRTGVPPVDRGTLMCYNTGNVQDWADTNSILDINTLTAYLVNFDRYPLALDLALPVFRWGIVFRDGQMIRLINGLTEEALSDRSRFDSLSTGRYRVKKGTYLQSHYLYADDLLRLEWIEPEVLSSTVKLLETVWPAQDMTLSFYQLDSAQIQNYPPTFVQDLIKVLEK